MANNDLIVLNELAESGSTLRPSIQVEHALAEIKDTYQTSPLAKIPFTEIAALGGSFAGVAETMATPVAEFNSAPPACLLKVSPLVILSLSGGDNLSIISPSESKSNSLFILLPSHHILYSACTYISHE